ncbi:hypothetical protein D4R42_05195 [bacterium]|nr:MAG: hypothetical protein D4R42_05195 [bacterium]
MDKDQEIRLVCLPIPSALTVIKVLNSLRFKGFFTTEDISYKTASITGTGPQALVFSLQRASLKTPLEEEMAIDAVTDVLMDEGYNCIATYDCGISNGGRLLLERVYKAQVKA